MAALLGRGRRPPRRPGRPYHRGAATPLTRSRNPLPASHGCAMMPGVSYGAGRALGGPVGSDCHGRAPPPLVHGGWARLAISHRRSPAKGQTCQLRTCHCNACMLRVSGRSASHCKGAISTWVGPCEAAICCGEGLVEGSYAHHPPLPTCQKGKHTCEGMPLQCKHAHAHCMVRIPLHGSDLHAVGLTSGNQWAVRGIRQAAASAHAAGSLEEAKGLPWEAATPQGLGNARQLDRVSVVASHGRHSAVRLQLTWVVVLVVGVDVWHLVVDGG